jgi:hypothetical protein
MLGPASSPSPVDALGLACGKAHWTALADRVAETAQLAEVPDKAELDPVLDRLNGRRLVVYGVDAALAAVVQRLLRTSRLEAVAVGFVPLDPSSQVAALWGLPTAPQQALTLALCGEPERVPLVRDDAGGVLVGLGRLRPLRGVVYCDDQLVLRGQASVVEVTPDPGAGPDTSKDGLTVRVRRTGLLGRRQTDTGGRAVQIGCIPAVVQRDGVPFDRSVDKWTWYRHTQDWRLVRGVL